MKFTCLRNSRILLPAFGKLLMALLMLAIASAAREGQQDGNSERLLLTDEEIYQNAVNDERTYRTYVSTRASLDRISPEALVLYLLYRC